MVNDVPSGSTATLAPASGQPEPLAAATTGDAARAAVAGLAVAVLADVGVAARTAAARSAAAWGDMANLRGRRCVSKRPRYARHRALSMYLSERLVPSRRGRATGSIGTGLVQPAARAFGFGECTPMD